MEDVAHITTGDAIARGIARPSYEDEPWSFTEAYEAIASTTYGWPAFVATLWFLVAFVGMLWLWRGAEPSIFNSPDEATTQYASRLVAETGGVEAPLPVEDDREDLAHLRAWISRGDTAIPSLPPMTFYVYGAFLSVPIVGAYFIPLLAALGVGAFSASLALLGNTRRWLALFAPVALFPGLYWLLRPWMNMSLYLSFVSMALLLWLAWRRERRTGLLLGVGALLGLAVAVRPDYAAVTLGTAVLCTLGEMRRADIRPALFSLALSIAEAACLLLVLNALTTGGPLTFGYEIADARKAQWGEPYVKHDLLPSPFSDIYYLILPNGLPNIPDAAHQIYKYWLQMWPASLITLSFPFALWALLRGKGRSAIPYALAALWVALFVVSRVGPGFFGAAYAEADIHHSFPRYWAPAYILAGVPLIALAMRSGPERVWLPAVICVMLLAVIGARSIYVDGGPESMVGLRYRIDNSSERVRELESFLPPDAVVYSSNQDKVLWSKWSIGIIPGEAEGTTGRQLDRAADSIARVARTDRPVFVMRKGQMSDTEFYVLDGRLDERGLGLAPAGPAELLLYEVVPSGEGLLGP